jgi:hypothetical protein
MLLTTIADWSTVAIAAGTIKVVTSRLFYPYASAFSCLYVRHFTLFFLSFFLVLYGKVYCLIKIVVLYSEIHIGRKYHICIFSVLIMTMYVIVL